MRQFKRPYPLTEKAAHKTNCSIKKYHIYKQYLIFGREGNPLKSTTPAQIKYQNELHELFVLKNHKIKNIDLFQQENQIHLIERIRFNRSHFCSKFSSLHKKSDCSRLQKKLLVPLRICRPPLFTKYNSPVLFCKIERAYYYF